jgi:DnaK suppressor protein
MQSAVAALTASRGPSAMRVTKASSSPSLEVGMVQSVLASSTRQPSIGGRWLARHLPALREELERQRDFRHVQLAHLIAHDENRTSLLGYGPRAMDGDAARALDEARAFLADGARQALADIELALARMNDGNYGWCRACGAGIPRVVLRGIPATTLCRACHRPAAPASKS